MGFRTSRGLEVSLSVSSVVSNEFALEWLVAKRSDRCGPKKQRDKEGGAWNEKAKTTLHPLLSSSSISVSVPSHQLHLSLMETTIGGKFTSTLSVCASN